MKDQKNIHSFEKESGRKRGKEEGKEGGRRKEGEEQQVGQSLENMLDWFRLIRSPPTEPEVLSTSSFPPQDRDWIGKGWQLKKNLITATKRVQGN